jgi:pimeloyl-ACP methyl ester carboxylesterase
MSRRAGILLILCTGLLVDLAPSRLRAASLTIVIGEFRTRGPNGVSDQFVQLYNRSASPVDISGYRILASTSGGSTSIVTTVNTGTILAAGCHYLLTNSTLPGYSGPVAGNQTFAALLTDAGGIAVATPSGTILDQVGAGVGSAYNEGTPLFAMSGTANQSYERKPGGASGHTTDTDDNAADFVLVASSPQNATGACLVDPAVQTTPTASGGASPVSAPPGGAILLTAVVTPGANPASSGLTVKANLSAIGGSTTQTFYDDGTHGDATSGDATFSVQATVGAAVAAGPKHLPITLGDAQARSGQGVIALTVLTSAQTADRDADGLTGTWELQFGLDPDSAIGTDGADGDPDSDGRTNIDESSAGTHPRGFFTRYLAEGATSAFFDTSLALANPGATTAATLLRFLRGDGSTVTHFLSVGGLRRTTVRAKDVAGLATAEFSTVIESDVPIVADRTMKWDGSGYGSHAETSLPAPETTWYLAEGATHSGFNLFYLIQNPNPQPASVEVTYLLPVPKAPIVRSYPVAANSRFNIWVDGEGAALADTDVSAVLSADRPIIVERAMYLDKPGQTFGAGHESAGITAPATEWFLAEGATGGYFDLFVLVANPGDTAAAITATFLLPDGTSLTKDYPVAARSRFNIWVDREDPLLADTAVSTVVTSTNGVPVIVERAMWWPGPEATDWAEAHNSAGATSTASRWVLAEGEVGPASGTETYILIANTSAFAGSARVTLLFDDGTTVDRTFPLNPNSRFNVDVAAEFPAAAGRRFGALVESLGDLPARLVVERAMYSDAASTNWAAGTNALATGLDQTLETAAAVITPSGGAIALPGGNQVSFPAGAFASSESVTVSSLASLSLQPANQSLTGTGPAVALTFESGAGGIAIAGEAVAEAGEPPIEVQFTVDPASLAGAVPVAAIVDLTGLHSFVGVPGRVEGTTATLSLSPGLIAGARRVEAGFVNVKPDLDQVPLPPQSGAGSTWWSGSDWVPGTTQVNPSARTVVVVHGIFSSADQAFGTCGDGKHAAAKLKQMGYGQVLGFNYDFTQGPGAAGDQLGAFLESLRQAGVTSVDVIGHSMGGTVALRGITKTTLRVDHLGTLGSPVTGTPLASLGSVLSPVVGAFNPVATALLNIPTPPDSLVNTVQRAAARFSFNDIVHGRWIADMALNSPALSDIRQAVIARMANPTSNLGATTAFAAGGSVPMRGAQVFGPLFGFKPHDGIVGQASGQAQGAGFDPTRLTPGGYRLMHTQFTCDDEVLTDLAQVFGLESPLPNEECSDYCYQRYFQESDLCTTGNLFEQSACVNRALGRLFDCLDMCLLSL